MWKQKLRNSVKKQAAKRSSKVSRMVLLVGDEGAILLHIDHGVVKSRQFSPEPQAKETRAFYETAMEHPKVPLIIIFDTIDQAYIQQTLPPVAALSVNKLIKRRLERDFSNDYLKGALPLGKDKGARKDWLFMMVALQRTPLVKTWLDLTGEWPNRCLGLYLLPVEATHVMKGLRTHQDGPVIESKIEKDDAKDKETSSRDDWYFLVSYNRVSGVRQIVCKGEGIVLTRLGQPALESDPEAVAGTIEQEVIGTKEYLKRLGFDDKDKLHLIIIVADDIRVHIDTGRLRADTAHALSPHAAALHLGLKDATQPSDRYGDVVLSAAIGTDSKPLMRLLTPEIKQLYYYYFGIYGGRILSVLLVIGLFAMSILSVWNIISMSGEATEYTNLAQQKKGELEGLRVKAKKTTSDDLEVIADVVTLYEKMTETAYNPELMLNQVGKLLDQEMRVSDFTWVIEEKPQPPGSPPPAAGAESTARVNLSLTIDLPVALTNERERLIQLTTDMLNRIKAGLPGYDVTYLSLPSIVSDKDQIESSLTESPFKAAAELNKGLQAKIQILGPAKIPAAPPAPPTPAVAGGANAPK